MEEDGGLEARVVELAGGDEHVDLTVEQPVDQRGRSDLADLELDGGVRGLEGLQDGQRERAGAVGVDPDAHPPAAAMGAQGAIERRGRVQYRPRVDEQRL